LIWRLQRLPVEVLRPHERIDDDLLDAVRAALQWRQDDLPPVIVDDGSWTILDGHHRHEAHRRLGYRRIPCLVVDYRSPMIRLEPRRTDLIVSKAEVVARARHGRLLPPKTTRHVLPRGFLPRGLRASHAGRPLERATRPDLQFP